MHALLAFALLATTPTWLAGDWEPYSNAFRGLEGLTVKGDTLTWHGCKDAHFQVVEAKGNSVTIQLHAGSRCTLNDVTPTRMDTVRFTLRDNQCDLGVSIYASPAA